MLFIVGTIIVLGCVFGGYIGAGGHMDVLWQPFEFIIIGGAAIGSFVISNPKPVLAKTGKAFGTLLKGAKYNKDSYLELLSLLFTIFKLAKSKGMLALEAHIENPEESDLFKRFPKFFADHHAMTFMTDYLRMMVLGSENAHEMETLLDEEIETHHHEATAVSDAIQAVADATPALGIVAAVLGVIHTMGSITEPPAVLGHLIGGALVGTFLGVLMAYGFIGPIASSLKAVYNAETKYYQCIKVALLAHMNGYAPSVSVEFARKALLSNVRPTFYEVEAAVQAVPAV
ncbi:MAG TPA: flagellar motor stator protein MotA [Alphaproteobacteria bacterium]|nr:flagellar motor stator protein MotA [Alphaproteobacteria bacterium]